MPSIITALSVGVKPSLSAAGAARSPSPTRVRNHQPKARTSWVRRYCWIQISAAPRQGRDRRPRAGQGAGAQPAACPAPSSTPVSPAPAAAPSPCHSAGCAAPRDRRTPARCRRQGPEKQHKGWFVGATRCSQGGYVLPHHKQAFAHRRISFPPPPGAEGAQRGLG